MQRTAEQKSGNIILGDFSGRAKGNRRDSKTQINPTPASKLTFQNICFQQKRENINLADISFTIEPGETLAILGPDGSGKSALLHLLMKLYQADSGDILLNGKSITDFPQNHLYRSIAIVPENTTLINNTIAYNIGIVRPSASISDIEQAAKLARIHRCIHALPEKYLTLIGDGGLQPSNLTRQYLALARAALKKPKLYVFSNNTSLLSAINERRVVKRMKNISRGASSLILTNRLSTAAHADTILVLDRGKIVQRGSHQDLLKKNGLYNLMWQAQQKNGMAYVV